MNLERTLVVIKPDGVERKLVGKIISYYEQAGLEVKEMKLIRPDEELISQHYPEDDEYMISLGVKSEKAGDEVKDHKEHGRMIVHGLRSYITSGPVVALIMEGEGVIQNVRKITGYTDPKTADKGTIRGDLGADDILTANKEKRAVRNIIHASGNREEAEKEIELWFPELE